MIKIIVLIGVGAFLILDSILKASKKREDKELELFRENLNEKKRKQEKEQKTMDTEK